MSTAAEEREAQLEAARALFQEQYDAAAAAWKFQGMATDGIPGPLGLHGGEWLTRYVDASAGTGSRYTVVASKLGEMPALGEGGEVCVTVLHPWQAAYVVQADGYLHRDYVAEKFGGERFHHGGDLAGLVLTIRQALGRHEDE